MRSGVTYFGLMVNHRVKEVMYSFSNFGSYNFVKMMLFNTSGYLSRRGWEIDLCFFCGELVVMIKIAFLLGRPGSGKSTLAQLIEASARKRGLVTQHLYDYKYLQDMFQQEIEAKVPLEERAFRQKGPEACQGFDVRDFNVLDIALEQMAKKISTEELDHSEENKLILIEFARKEYCRALHIFGFDILRDAHLFYIKLGLETCIERVHQRVVENCSKSEFDHFVSEEIMNDYYNSDDWLDGRISEYRDYLQRDHVHVSIKEIDNLGTYRELEEKVEEIVSLLVPELTTVL